MARDCGGKPLLNSKRCIFATTCCCCCSYVSLSNCMLHAIKMCATSIALGSLQLSIAERVMDTAAAYSIAVLFRRACRVMPALLTCMCAANGG